MTEQLIEKCKKYQNHFSKLLKVPCTIVDLPDSKAPCMYQQQGRHSFCDKCQFDKAKSDLLATCYYGCNEAHRWNGKYVYYCPMGLVFVAASISSELGALSGGLILGPIVMGEHQDVIADIPLPVSLPFSASRIVQELLLCPHFPNADAFQGHPEVLPCTAPPCRYLQQEW